MENIVIRLTWAFFSLKWKSQILYLILFDIFHVQNVRGPRTTWRDSPARDRTAGEGSAALTTERFVMDFTTVQTRKTKILTIVYFIKR